MARVADSLVDETTGEPLLRTHALTPETGLPFHSPDVYVTTPARAVDDLLRFRDGAWRRGTFSPVARTLRHVVFDEADMLFSGGYLKPLRMCFDVLYREEKLASEGFFLDGERRRRNRGVGRRRRARRSVVQARLAQGSPRRAETRVRSRAGG